MIEPKPEGSGGALSAIFCFVLCAETQNCKEKVASCAWAGEELKSLGWQIPPEALKSRLVLKSSLFHSYRTKQASPSFVPRPQLRQHCPFSTSVSIPQPSEYFCPRLAQCYCFPVLGFHSYYCNSSIKLKEIILWLIPLFCDAKQLLLKLRVLLHSLLKRKQFQIYIELIQLWWSWKLDKHKMSGDRKSGSRKHLDCFSVGCRINIIWVAVGLTWLFSKISQVIRIPGMTRPWQKYIMLWLQRQLSHLVQGLEFWKKKRNNFYSLSSFSYLLLEFT